MKSRKLTVGIKDAIVSNFEMFWVKQNPKPSVDKCLSSIKSDFGKSLREELYGKFDNKIPVEHMFLASEIKVQLPNESVGWFTFRDDTSDIIHLPMKRVDGVHISLVGQADNPHYVTYRTDLDTNKEQCAAIETWTNELNKFKNQVMEVLNSVSTTKQFVEVWPEAEKFLPPEVADPSNINLPAIASIMELNKIITKE